MLIRSEAPVDILAIDNLLKEVFDSYTEAELVMSLRENGHNTLSLVACTDEGELVGHLMFSPVFINNNDTGIQGLTPICIHPDYQGQNIEALLVQEGLDILTELGYPACVALGDMHFYRCFGFLPAAEFNLTCQRKRENETFMAIGLNATGFSGQEGLVTYCSEFNVLGNFKFHK